MFGMCEHTIPVCFYNVCPCINKVRNMGTSAASTNILLMSVYPFETHKGSTGCESPVGLTTNLYANTVSKN
jgi:hypothetical protein